MSQFNGTRIRPAVTSPVTTTATATNAHGRAGHVREERSELFLLGVALRDVKKDAFYERADARVARFCTLVRGLALSDPAWLTDFLRWLRGDGNLRTAPLVAAAEFTAARRGTPDPDQLVATVVDAVLQRADEPGELVGYWTSNYGSAIPKGMKKGIARAVIRLYDEYSLSKYDRDGLGFRFARILDLVHPSRREYGDVLTPPADFDGSAESWLAGEVARKSALFAYAHADMRGRQPEIPAELTMLRARAELTALPVAERRAVLTGPDGVARLRAAGMTWEAVAGWLHGPMDADAWSAVIPIMGYGALLKNLRNFDDVGVPEEVAERVAARLADPARVAKSRLFPFNFYGAHKAVGSLRWGAALEKALQASLANVPALPGRTLVLVDQSPSMWPGHVYSSRQEREHVTNAELATLFGSAVALRAAGATLAGYGGTSYRVGFRRGDALLNVMGRFRMENYTDTLGAVAAHFDRHDRVLIVTDEQHNSGRYRSIDQIVPKDVPVYTWNIGGYKVGANASGAGTRHTVGGLTDHAFRLVSLMEAGRNADWPWLVAAVG
ncbi:TROVE domain-containing protein [Micromonospora sp. RV43]|uniref:TROVE domain-containing protein n=1 Tax=Micromonospora sp. RV43 TaxID=1661387 RepID=UPI00064C0FFE|nr:TROVE domain-containing protein [Micromonospora sp. RV43]